MNTRFLTGRPLPLQVPTAFVRIRPTSCDRDARLRRVEARVAAKLCSSASVPAAVGSRSPRRSRRPRGSVRVAGIEIALVPITTAGDRDRTKPFGEIGSRGVFVKELEEALLEGRIDVAVHSAKDMTSIDPEGLVVGAYPPREDPRDALCGASELRPGMRIGTASVRRRAQLLALEPTLSIEPLRGNIDTRLRKRGERGLDAVVLAACGLDRLGLDAEIGHRFDPDELLPEAGQGSLALQVRAGEEALVAAADDAETRRRVEAERRCVALVGGGCLAPVAAFHDGASLTALVADEDGAWIERRTGVDPEAVARELLVVRLVKVVVTRPQGQEEELIRGLVALRHEVVHCPLLEVEPLGDEPVDVSGYDWVIVTSVNGARELRRRMTGTPSRVAAIGRATADAFGGADLVPAVSTQEGLLAELPSPAGRVLFAGAEGARRLLVDELGRGLRAALPHAGARRRSKPRTATSSCSRRRRRRGRSAVSAPTSRRSASGRRRRRRRATPVSRWCARRRRTTSRACSRR